MGNASNKKLETFTIADFDALVKEHGSLNKAAVACGIPKETFKGVVRRLRRLEPYKAGTMKKPIKHAPPRTGVKRFIFSSAQNGTAIDENFLTNLEAYAAHLDAEILISGFTYGKSLFEDHSKSNAQYHTRVEPYITNRSFDIAGKLLFCGEMNVLPTADKPLSGFEAYTRSKWGIFPHPRIQLQSIATNAATPPKIIMTTGAVTKKNYIQKKAGIKAEFHHIIGAVLVEVDSAGDVFCRHLLAERDGTFQDLTTRVCGGKVSTGWRVEAVTWGDLHIERLDDQVAKGCWGLGKHEMLDGAATPRPSMVDELEPQYQFFHDVLDFRRRNHHNIKDPHHMFEMWAKGSESVEEEISDVSLVLARTARLFAQSIVIDSNHDRALKRWLKESDYKRDPVNARYFLECQARVYKAIEDDEQDFLLAGWAIGRSIPKELKVKFLKNTDSLIICGNIECALHGDLGANGARGHVNSFARMGPKANIGHHHGAAIFEGIYQAGTTSQLDMVFNRGGLSSWNHSHIVTYPNGRRAIVTMVGSKWRAAA